jgi:hypothetical protein
MRPPVLAIALMALGRDAPWLASALPALRGALARDAPVTLIALLDEANSEQLGAVLPHADVIGASARRTGFAHARRRALHTALSLRPQGVLVCDGDGQFPAESIAAVARTWLASPASVVIPQRRGHTLPAGAAVPEGAREDLERLENAAGAVLARRPDLAARDLQPGGFAMPTDVVQHVLENVTAEDFSWELECALALVKLPTRPALMPEIPAAPQSHTTFVPSDVGAKVRMLARYHGRARVLEVLQEIRDGAHGVKVPAALVDRVVAELP